LQKCYPVKLGEALLWRYPASCSSGETLGGASLTQTRDYVVWNGWSGSPRSIIFLFYCVRFAAPQEST
jgi:hypothetical protein